MSGYKNTITINGRLYDSISGALISDSPKTATNRKPVKSIDPIIIRPTGTSLGKTSQKTPKNIVSKEVVHVAVRQNTPTKEIDPKTKISNIKLGKARTRTRTIAVKAHRKTEHAKTLMRNSVAKPRSFNMKSTTIAVTGLLNQPDSKIIRGNKQEREKRASKILLSSQISKFKSPTNKVISRRDHIPVRQAPSSNSKTTQDDSPMSFALKQAPPINIKRAKVAANMPENIFETALRQANHHQPSNIGKKAVRKHSKLIRAGSSFALIVLLVGFFAYHNATGIALRSASSKAGFVASLPKYKPVGFALSNSINAEFGKVVLNYRSNTGGNGFSLTQQKQFDGQQYLLNQYLASKNNTYSTETANGQPVYIYDQSNATWQTNGIWYNLQGNALLSENQILQIVSTI